MRHPSATCLLLIIGATSLQPAVSSAAEVWGHYTNERFGTSAEVPLRLFKAQPASDNDDGRVFIAADGAELRVHGSYAPWVVTNGFEDYKGWLRDSFKEDGVNLTYQANRRGWAAYSGLQGSMVVYYKIIEGCGAAHTVYAEYPQSLKKTYDPIVERVSRSLRCKTPVRRSQERV